MALVPKHGALLRVGAVMGCKGIERMGLSLRLLYETTDDVHCEARCFLEVGGNGAMKLNAY